MNILFVGDIYGRPGRRAASEWIPKLFRQRAIDVCIANGENAAGGFGITEGVAQKLFAYGIDVITTGNHVWDKKEVLEYIGRASALLRPANYPPGVAGRGRLVVRGRNDVPVGVLNLQGRVHMRDIDCPFRVGQDEIEKLRQETSVILVDFHAEATSEKIAFGWYVDGKVSAVIGTHTHVQTGDERILPGGTAYITDVGMTGPYDSVIGAEKRDAIRHFLTQMPTKFTPAKQDIRFCAVLIDVDEETGKARRIERIVHPLDAGQERNFTETEE
jgi:metallophosphoesterase (TIGR00282 family)